MVAIPTRKTINQLMLVSTVGASGVSVYTHASEAYAVVDTLVFISTGGGAGALYFTMASGVKVFVVNAALANTTYQLTNLGIILQNGDTLTAHNGNATSVDFAIYAHLWL